MSETISDFAPFNEPLTVEKFRQADIGGKRRFKRCLVLERARKVIKVIAPGERR